MPIRTVMALYCAIAGTGAFTAQAYGPAIVLAFSLGAQMPRHKTPNISTTPSMVNAVQIRWSKAR